jgi:hypothetical protein
MCGMGRHAKTLPVGRDNTRHLSAGLMAATFPALTLERIIGDCGRSSKRVRDLPAVVVAYYVIALSMFPSVGYQSVLEWLLGGLRWLDAGHFRISGKGSLSRARARLGEEPMRQAFLKLAHPLNRKDLLGSYWRALHLVAIDGTTLALQDTTSNEKGFGRSTNQHGGGGLSELSLRGALRGWHASCFRGGAGWLSRWGDNVGSRRSERS